MSFCHGHPVAPRWMRAVEHLAPVGSPPACRKGPYFLFFCLFSCLWAGVGGSCRSLCLFTDLYIYLLSFPIVYSKYSLVLCLLPYPSSARAPLTVACPWWMPRMPFGHACPRLQGQHKHPFPYKSWGLYCTPGLQLIFPARYHFLHSLSLSPFPAERL